MKFENWLSTFRLEDNKKEISELLVNSPSIRALYNKMVPAAVAHSEFWQRYFYKVFQLDQEESRRLALKQRAEQTTHTESLGWEEEEEDDFIGAAASTPPHPAANLDNKSTNLTLTTTTAETSLLTPGPSPCEEHDVTHSVSSDSLSQPTQVEVQAEPVATELTQKLTEASLEDVKVKSQETQQPSNRDSLSDVQDETVTRQAGRDEGAPTRTPASVSKPAIAKEEGPQDLRVFELNSDSGKSTPSNNGKKGSSTDVSEDWEKDFDLDMTEEEVQLALSKIEASGELDEDWENWD